MIKFRMSDKHDWQTVTPTIFPDGTSQVWKLNLESKEPQATIRWDFESESELIQIVQLSDLLYRNGQNTQHLEMPYFPYARQDKKVQNDLTFARNSFMRVLYHLSFSTITTYDIHSDPTYTIDGFKNNRPNHFLDAIINFGTDAIFFPDEGAMKRYQSQFLDSPMFNMIPKMYGNKVRNQQTGMIEGYKVTTWKDFHNKERILILDDICDGGATFIAAANELNKLNVGEIGLCVSHGIFSKGVTPLAQRESRKSTQPTRSKTDHDYSQF
jgi:ribose-phosphate pyrophosphokinase